MKITNWHQFINAILLRKVSFAVAFFCVFLISYAVLAWADFLPEPVVSSTTQTESTAEAGVATALLAAESKPTPEPEYVITPEVAPQLPDTIIIDKLDRTIQVLNPTSRAIADLDAALLYGVVRHPDSATLNQAGTVFILGHSSYLPTVLNHNFQAFNGIQNLRFGDMIKVQSGTTEYEYRVDKVYRAKTADVIVPIAGDSQRLVLATCNSFGSKDDRYIVEAELIETKVL